MKKILAILSALIIALSLASCGAEKTDAETSTAPETTQAVETPDDAPSGTIGSQYLRAFNTTSATSADAIADEMIALNAFDTELVKMEVEPGFLNGFSEEITNFTSGTMFSPMIGSIPFVGYVFETDDAEGLLQTLKATADTRWLICTEADETVSAVNGNLVFFLMCTNESETDGMQ